MSDNISKDETKYALCKQIYKGFSLQTNYGEIRLFQYEYDKLEKLLIKMLDNREEYLKDQENYK